MTATDSVGVSVFEPGGFATDPVRYADASVSELVMAWAQRIPDRSAFVSASGTVSWRAYDRLADVVCATLHEAVAAVGGACAALMLPDTAAVHAALVGCWRAGRRAAAIGARSGDAEAAHIMSATQSRVLVTSARLRGRKWHERVLRLSECGAAVAAVVVVDESAGTAEVHVLDAEEAQDAQDVQDAVASPAPGQFTTDDVTILNATSGTTGLPKIVAHTERKWVRFTQSAMTGARITGADVLCSAVPAPFGFGLWSAHFLPALLGVPVVVIDGFDARETAMLVARESVSVLCCVTTQFKMLMHTGADDTEGPDGAEGGDGSRGWQSLRVLYTGGEAVGHADARAFERRTGATVLQFYGSNEAGAVSRTTLDDDEDTRLGTCGRALPEAGLRVLDDDGTEIAARPARGRPAVRGPLLSAGYWHDEAANAQLYTDDGAMLLGDVVEVDADERVRVVGRTAEIIIRGGKNISIAEVERAVRAEPAIDDVVVVPMPDRLFGERVCAVVTAARGEDAGVDVHTLGASLRRSGASAEYLPEYIVVVDEIPLGPGGKADRRAAQRHARAVLGVPDETAHPVANV